MNNCLISPFFVLWYPAMAMDNLGIIDSIKTALMTGKKLFYKFTGAGVREFAVFAGLSAVVLVSARLAGVAKKK